MRKATRTRSCANARCRLTGAARRQRIITDLGTIDIGAEGLILRELAPGVTIEEIRAATEPELQIPVEPMVMDLPRLAAARLEI